MSPQPLSFNIFSTFSPRTQLLIFYIYDALLLTAILALVILDLFSNLQSKNIVRSPNIITSREFQLSQAHDLFGSG